MSASLVIVALVLLQPEAINGRDVVRAIGDREAGVSNFSYHAQIDAWWEGDDLNAAASMRQDVTIVGDARGRYRLEGVEQRHGKAPGGAPVSLKQIQVFDGDLQREATGVGALTHGRITGKRGPFQLPFEPAIFVTEFHQRPVSRFLQEREKKNAHATQVEGRTDFDGRSVLVVATFPVEVGGKFWKSQFYVDDERAFSVVRKAALVRDAASDDWAINSVCELTDNFEAAPGIWVPRHATSTDFQKLEGQPWHFLAHVIARIDDWVVNAQPPESTFDFNFPPNVFVTDELTGKSYMTGLVNDPLVEARSHEAMRMASRRYTWVAVAVSIGLFAVLLLAVRAARARSAPGGPPNA